MRGPLISVLLPVRDEASYLTEALESVTAQTLEDFEAIVVDDGSHDGSAEIAERHARMDRRFRVVRESRSGLVPALERGRAEARGRFLARMDGDDVALPERLEAQLEVLEAERLVACGTGIRYFPEQTVRQGSRRYERWLNGLVTAEAAARDVLVECPLAHPTLLARREAVEDAGGYQSRGWPEDYDLVLRLWADGGRFRNVDRVLLRWRDHPGRASRTDASYTADAFVRCKVHHLRATLLRGWGSVVSGVQARLARRSRGSSDGRAHAWPLSSTSIRARSATPSTASRSCRWTRRRPSRTRSRSAPWPGRRRVAEFARPSPRRGAPRGSTSSPSPRPRAYRYPKAVTSCP